MYANNFRSNFWIKHFYDDDGKNQIELGNDDKEKFTW